MKKKVLLILRGILAVALIAWIYNHADAADFGMAMASVNPWLLVALAAAVIAVMLMQGVKWWVLIHRFAPDLKLGRALSVHIESVFYTAVLPSGAHDVVKSVMLSKTQTPAVVWAASWLARLMGLVSLLFFSVVGLLYLDSDILPEGFRTSLIIAVIAIVLLSALSFSKTLTRPFRVILSKWVGAKIMSRVEKLRDGIYMFKHERKTLALAFLASTATHLLIVFNVTFVVYIVSGNFYFVECLAFVPLVEIMVVALPITPGGLGVREALMALLFVRLGFDGAQIAVYVTLSLFTKIMAFAGAVPPLYRTIAGKGKK